MAKTVVFYPELSDYPLDTSRAYRTRKGLVTLEAGENYLDEGLIHFLEENKSFSASVSSGVIELPDDQALTKPAIDSVKVEDD